MMPAQLPLEILAFIFDVVAANTFGCQNQRPDITDLQNCALVSPVLTVHCQKHIFSHIQISHGKPDAISSLQQVLEVDHPEIGSYIKVLSVTLCPHEFNLSQPNIDRILDKCTAVTNLTIACDQVYHSGLIWNVDIPKSTQIALESIIHSPACKILDFDGIRMPFSVLLTSCRCVPAQSLSFSRRSTAWQVFEAIPDKIQDHGPSYSSLRFLSLFPSLIPAFISPMFHDGQYLFDLSNLGTLWVDHRNSDVLPNMTVQLLRRTMRLRTLGFKLISHPPNLVRDILSEPIPCFATTLSEIRLNITGELVFVGDYSNKDPFVGTLDGLRVALWGRNVVKIIDVEMKLGILWCSAKIVQERWLRAATTFSDPGSFPLLQEFSVHVLTSRMTFPDHEIQEYKFRSGEQIAEDLLEIPFDTLDLPYKFNFTVQSL